MFVCFALLVICLVLCWKARGYRQCVAGLRTDIADLQDRLRMNRDVASECRTKLHKAELAAHKLRRERSLLLEINRDMNTQAIMDLLKERERAEVYKMRLRYYAPHAE